MVCGNAEHGTAQCTMKMTPFGSRNRACNIQHLRTYRTCIKSSLFHSIANDMQNDLNDLSRETLEKIRIKGNQLIDRVREVIEEGNARRILVQKDNRTVMEFPLVFGVGGAAAAIMIAPTLAAIGAFASLASDIQVVIERRESESDEENQEEAVAETNEA